MTGLHDFVDEASLAALIATARREDLGPEGLDATSRLFIDPSRRCEARIVCRAAGTIAGLALLPAIARAYDPGIELHAAAVDGAAVARGDAVATLRGPLPSVLAAERVMLNFVGHLSGVATHTAAFARQIAHTSAKVYDTRKTLPGLRGVQKYAVACGGGGTHRMGLYDAVLVKDNHLAHVPTLGERGLLEALRAMVARARREVAGLKFVMVEVDTLEQLERVLPAGVDVVLLDNMPPAMLREAVRRRDAFVGVGEPGEPGDGYPPALRVELEASGGVTLETVRAIAETGVDRISVGALTHSSVNLDVGLDIA